MWILKINAFKKSKLRVIPFQLFLLPMSIWIGIIVSVNILAHSGSGVAFKLAKFSPHDADYSDKEGPCRETKRKRNKNRTIDCIFICLIIPAHSGSVRGVAIDGLNQITVTGSSDKTLKFWKFKTKQLLHTLEIENPVNHMLLHRER